jgi:predicted tellurium resistance membrane protein TerC
MDAFLTSSGLVALITLTFLEIVLGVDNVIFISILSSKLPGSQQGPARRMGLLAAMGMRIVLLLSIVWITRLTTPFFYILGRPISGRDLILIGGGLFLLAKATIEIHERLEGEEGHSSARVRPSFSAVISQIVVLDIVFSLDSVITAVGMADEITIMATAVILAVGVMMFSAGPISSFVKSPSDGESPRPVFLTADWRRAGRRRPRYAIPKGYIYFAMGFSVFVEMINLRVRRVAAPVHLHEPYV